MALTAPIPVQTTTPADISEKTLLAGLALTSFAALLLELALTRLFSVVLFYHFAFLAISIALLGLGAGGVFAYLQKTRVAKVATRTLASRICMANAVVIVVTLEIVLHVPVALNVSGKNFLRLTVMYLAAAIPFFLTGLLFSVVFARETSRIPRLYGADLCGGALACLAVVPLLNWLGGPNAILVAGIALAGAAIIWANSALQRRNAGLLALALSGLTVANYSGRLIDVVYAKGMFRDPAWVEFARWNALSRVEVDRQGGAKAIVIDADASTYIMNADVSQWHKTGWEDDLMSAPPALANVLRPRGQFAIIGPGGGVDVLRAVANGSPNVTGIEINPIIVNNVMRGRYADYSYHLYDLPQVHIHVQDGRSYIRSSSDKYDVVQMTLVDTWASTAAGAFALSENNLYTVEAFREYFDHLKPDGMIAITRWEFKQPREALRVVSQAIEALHQIGVADPRSHFIIVADGGLNEDGRPVLVLAKKSPFTDAEYEAVDDHVRANPNLVWLNPVVVSHDPCGPNVQCMIVDTPVVKVPAAPQTSLPPAAEVFQKLIDSNDPRAFAQNYDYNVAPVSDSAPFFFFTLKTGYVLRNIFAGTGRGMDWRINLGVVVLGMLLIISALAVLAFLILPLALHRRRPEKAHRAGLVALFYFIAVGFGYILVEISLIQRFVLFLGHPTYALTVVVFLLLLSSGVGSVAARRRITHANRMLPLLGLICGLIVLNVLVLPWLLSAAVGLPFAIKLLISALVLAPLGFLMGMPFPTGLRLVPTVEWAWALNAAASVLGSVLAMVIAIQFGLTTTLLCAAAAYFFAALFSATWRGKVIV